MKPVFARGNIKTIKNLEKERKVAFKEKEPRVAMRINGIILSLEKNTTGDISNMLKVERTTVYSWIKLWNQYKMNGLLEGHRSGRKSRIDKLQKDMLFDIVDSGPIAYGFDGGVWTSIMITKVIEIEFNIKYHPAHVRKLLHKLGFSIQRPTAKLISADPKKQNRWKRYTYPNLKKKQK